MLDFKTPKATRISASTNKSNRERSDKGNTVFGVQGTYTRISRNLIMPRQSETRQTRRHFLKGTSAAGVALLAADSTVASAAGMEQIWGKTSPDPVRLGLIGCGKWGREILKTLAKLPEGPVVAVAETHPVFLRRSQEWAPQAERYTDYRALLDDKAVQAVVVATPTHQHKEIVLAALQSGKHVYCEAPLAPTVGESREITRAAKDHFRLHFQAGLQLRSDRQITHLISYLHSDALGKPLKARAQSHQNSDWREISPNPDREKEINWRLDPKCSLGLAGEIGIHPLDLVGWALKCRPLAVTGFGSLIRWRDGLEVCDNVTATLEYPGGVFLNYEATLGNSHDGELCMLYGTERTIMMRDRLAWQFTEPDVLPKDWETYSRKTRFYKTEGTLLSAGWETETRSTSKEPFPTDPTSAIQYALEAFLVHARSTAAGTEDFDGAYGLGHDLALRSYLLDLRKGYPPYAGFQEGHDATVIAIKAHEAIVQAKRVQFDPGWFET